MEKNSKIKQHKNNEKKTSSQSLSSSKRLTASKISNNENSKYRSDKVEKKFYLDNITMKNDLNLDLLSKLSSTYRSYNFQFNNHDQKIESNLFHIGSRRSILLRKSMNQLRNMIQDFDDHFSLNTYNINNNARKSSNINNTKQIKEESYSDYDFNLYKIYDNDNKGEKIEKYLKEEKSYENELKNEKKIIGLKNAFKYYELLYNYKYLLTEKDISCLRFNQRKKMEKFLKEKYLKKSRIKLEEFYKTCEKCQKTRTIDKWKYKNNLKLHLFNKNFSDSNLKLINNVKLFKTELNNKNNNSNEPDSKNVIKRAFSGIISQKNLIDNNSNNNYTNTITRTTSASTHKILEFNKTKNLKFLSSSKKLKLNLNLSNSSSTSFSPHPSPNRLCSSKNSSKFLSIKREIQNLSQNILTNGEELKNNLEKAYQNIMEKIEEEKKPVKKLKKKIKIDIEKIRKDLNLKRRGKGIDEYKMIMDNVDKLYKSLPKTHVNLMRTIAKIVIYEDLQKNKPLIYDDTSDNQLFKNKFKKEMFKASYKMKKIRKSLNKNKTEKPFTEKLKHLLKDDNFNFYNIKSLKGEIDKIKVLRGEIIKN